MATIPSAATIEYWESHLDDNKAPIILATYISFLVIAYVAVALRFTSRLLIKTPLKVDDWAIALGLLFTTLEVVITLAYINNGLGRHANYINDVPKFAKLVIFSEVIYNPAVIAIKGSILYLYSRIFPARKFRITLWAVFALVVAYNFTQAFLDIFQCVPIAAIWNPFIPNPVCINFGAASVFCSTINIVTDFIIIGLPIPKLYALRISQTKKIQLIGIFLLGSFVCVVSIVRVSIIREISRVDPSWDDVNPGIWTVIELCVGILTACLPTLLPVLNLAVHGKAAGRSHPSGASGQPDSHKSIRMKAMRVTKRNPLWTHTNLNESDAMEITRDADPDGLQEITREEEEHGEERHRSAGAVAISNESFNGVGEGQGFPSRTIQVQTNMEQESSSADSGGPYGVDTSVISGRP